MLRLLRLVVVLFARFFRSRRDLLDHVIVGGFGMFEVIERPSR
jgi:hypothetical protein